MNQNGLICLNDRRHWIPGNSIMYSIGKDRYRINNRSEPKPELYDHTGKLPNVPEKYIKHANDHAQANGKKSLNHQGRKYAEEYPTGEVFGQRKKSYKQSKKDEKIKTCTKDDYQRKTDTRKGHFFDEISVFYENGLTAVDDFRKKTPSHYP